MNSSSFTAIKEALQVLDLRRTSTDLTAIENRRFMFHPSGILILGAEDMVNSSDGLFKSHAEEYGDASERSPSKLPPYDEFVRGWIGIGGDYPHGIIHFAPAISTGYLPHYNAAFSFIEESLQNGFTEQSMLRGFCHPWEQTISHLLGHDRSQQPSLDEQIRKAKVKTPSSIPKQGRGPLTIF